MRAIQAREAGGPEVLELVELADPTPGPGQVLVKVAAAGVNFIDTYRRGGVYPMPFPHVVGSEGAGEVVGLGDGVTDVAVGDRVAWSDAPASYAELTLVDAPRLVPVPAGVGDDVAAALPLQGMTAHYLVTSTYPVQPGDDVLVHAAAGGVGLLLTQLVIAHGGRVIATVSTAEKEALAREAGADVVIRYDQLGDLTAELPTLVKDATGGKAWRSCTTASARPPSTPPGESQAARDDGPLRRLQRPGAAFRHPAAQLRGSLYLTRPTLGFYVATTTSCAGVRRSCSGP